MKGAEKQYEKESSDFADKIRISLSACFCLTFEDVVSSVNTRGGRDWSALLIAPVTIDLLDQKEERSYAQGRQENYTHNYFKVIVKNTFSLLTT